MTHSEDPNPANGHPIRCAHQGQTVRHGAPRAYVDFVRSQVFRPEPKTGLGTLVRTKKVFKFADLAAAPTYGDNLRKATVDLAGARTLIEIGRAHV